MEYVKFGKTGLKVSRLWLGCMTYGTPDRGQHPWTMPEDASRPLIKQALELGINVLDTANTYSDGTSEEIIGRAVKDFARRDEVIITSKVCLRMRDEPNGAGLSRKAIFTEVNNSLRRLGTDYIDLYQIHRWDPATPIEETMEALHDVVKSGKARYIGASSMWAWQFAKAQQVAKEHGWTRFVSMQNHYNLAYREEEREMIPLCRDQRVALIPWSPLARGFLSGNRRADDSEQGATRRAKTDAYAHRYYYRSSDFKVVQVLSRLAQKKGVSPATLAYAWLLHKGVAAPIVGASKAWQLDQAVAALDVGLSAQEMTRLEAPYQPHPVLGHA